MEWIRTHFKWESSWIILLDLSVEEYKTYRAAKRRNRRALKETAESLGSAADSISGPSLTPAAAGV